LLGLSSPAEREHIEAEYFEHEGAFQEMLMAEDDLIDAYARGELAGEERRRFENSFASSLGGRDRVQFARAFAGTTSATRSVDTKLSGTLLDIFKIFHSPLLVRIATVGTVIVFVTVLAWLVIDRRRMTNKFRELRAESAELSNRTEALQRSSDTERARTGEVAAQRADPGAEPVKPSHRERGTTQRVRHLPEIKNDREKIASSKPEQAEKLINTQDATLGNTFNPIKITELPRNDSNIEGLLTLQRGTIREGHVGTGRTDPANINLEGVDVVPLNSYSLLPQNRGSNGEVTIRIPTSLNWIRFQISLETAAIHRDSRVIIQTADGRPVTSVDWIEPITPNQTIIDTPVISTGDLPSGDYVLLLMGKEPDGSFVKVAEYSFKLIKV
jgi:hypothetical protein